MTDPRPVLALAMQHHRARRFADAEQLYRQVLAEDPNQVDALHLLGMLAYDTGQLPAAVELVTRAIAVNSNLADLHSNLGFVLLAQGKSQQAADALRKAIQINPNHADAHFHLGNAMANLNQFDQAVASFRASIALKPANAVALNNLGNALRAKGDNQQAIEAYRRAIAIDPNNALPHNNLGTALLHLQQADQAIAEYQTAIWLQPNLAEAHYNLGNAMRSRGQYDAAIASFQTAARLKPDYTDALNNLGNAYRERGQLDEAMQCYRQAIATNPDHRFAQSNLAYAMLLHWNCDPQAIAEEYRRWNRRFVQPLRNAIKPHTNDRDPDRRIRIGYVSPDLRDGSVGRFMLPLMQHHDHQQFQIVCYCDVPDPDHLTSQLRQCADEWRDVAGVSDENLAEMIRADRIDILVDLALHTAFNRMLVFARKPAPVQATYLAYCGTSGVETIDFRVTDPYLDPPGQNDAVYWSDRYICRTRSGATTGSRMVQIPNPLPALSNGYVTFGCLNNFAKVTPPTLDAWARLLSEVPNSKLALHAPVGDTPGRVSQFFAEMGIDPARLSFMSGRALRKYFEVYQTIDIGLDPLPYTGGTTTCDALWMGVPVVSLAGRLGVHRGGVSILSNAGIPELVANSIDEYIRIAAGLARDLPKLSEIRAGLRAKMQSSPLMDAPRFARDIETLYRQMWRPWCEGSLKPSAGSGISS